MCRKLIYLGASALVLGLVASAAGQGLKGEYFNNMTLSSPAVLTRVEMVDFDWGDPGSPAPSVSVDQFSARWTGGIIPLYSDNYIFHTRTDDGVRLWVDDRLLINNWTDHSPMWDSSAPVALKAGKAYSIKMEWYENGGEAVAELYWQSASQALQTIPGAQLLPTKVVRLSASKPNPADGAIGVLMPLLQWMPGERAVFHDIYFGTNPALGPAQFRGRQPFAIYWHMPGLVPGVTYCWRIDELEADGVTRHTGDVWSFTAASSTASRPNPPDGAGWVDTEANLSWSPGVAAIMHDVYFGTSEADVTNGTGDTFKGKQAVATYEPGPLQADTTYYWRIDENDYAGKKYAGAVWHFTTVGSRAGIMGEYFNNMGLRGNPVLVRIDPGVNFYWGVGTSPALGLPEDNFSVRWTGLLEPPLVEPFIFTTYSNDGVRLYLDGQLIIDNWTDHERTQNWSQPMELVAGQTYLIVLEGYENTGEAEWQLYWQSLSIPRQIIPPGPLSLVSLPALGVEPAELKLTAQPNSVQQAVFVVGEILGKGALHCVNIQCTDLVGRELTIKGSDVTFDLNNFDVAPGGQQVVHVFVPVPSDFREKVAGSIVVQSAEGSTRSIALTVKPAKQYAPTADAGGPYTGVVGQPIRFDAGGSYDPDGEITWYGWDFDGDGKYEATRSATCEHTWLSEFSGTVTLLVTDDDGCAGVAAATVVVTAP